MGLFRKTAEPGKNEYPEDEPLARAIQHAAIGQMWEAQDLIKQARDTYMDEQNFTGVASTYIFEASIFHTGVYGPVDIRVVQAGFAKIGAARVHLPHPDAPESSEPHIRAAHDHADVIWRQLEEASFRFMYERYLDTMEANGEAASTARRIMLGLLLADQSPQALAKIQQLLESSNGNGNGNGHVAGELESASPSSNGNNTHYEIGEDTGVLYRDDGDVHPRRAVRDDRIGWPGEDTLSEMPARQAQQ